MINERNKYNSECTYKEETVAGIIISKEKHNILICAKPVIFRMQYKIEVQINKKNKIYLDDSVIYNTCQINDSILIKITKKYYKNKCVSTNYNTVDITSD